LGEHIMSKVCMHCIAELEEDTKFCPKCGAEQGKNQLADLSKSTEFIPTIEVLRESSMIGCLFSYDTFIDGVKIGTIKNGEKKQFQITPGLHEIYLKQNWSWCYSPKVSFLLKDFTKFSCKPKVGLFGVIFGRVVLYMLFKRHKFVELKEV
jgi:hypothetical protein